MAAEETKNEASGKEVKEVRDVSAPKRGKPPRTPERPERPSGKKVSLTNRLNQLVCVNVQMDGQHRMIPLTSRQCRTLTFKSEFYSPHARQLHKEGKIILKTS